MTANCLDIITQITVEIHKADNSKEKLGSGILYTNRKLLGSVYVLTAKHCLSRLKVNEKVSFRVLNPEKKTYEYLTPVKQTILLHPVDDAGIVVFNQRELARVCPTIPSVFVVDKNVGFDEAVTKGFPMASLNQTNEHGESSLVTLSMRYLQEITSEQAFQLSTTDDYNEDTIKGMSGAGIFIEACEELYVNGIFTRFTDEGRGKVIYSQRLTSFNELLEKEYKRKIPLSFLGRHGLGHKTFKNNVDNAIANLGPRYCRKVNVKTGTAKYFDCVAKTSLYYGRLNRAIDGWLTEKSYRTRKDSSRIGQLESHLKAIRDDFTAALKGLDTRVETAIDFTDLTKRVDDLENELEIVRHNLYSEYPTTEKDEQIRKEFEADETRLSEISRDLYTFRSNFEDLKIGLANNPYLIIKGEAGCGKSHLMGDVANKRIEGGLPTVLFLGTDFTEETYEKTIISKIGFSGTYQEFLSSFNQIGIQVGSRALLMIDALNEGPQALLWKDRLSGFIKSLKGYPAIGLVVTVRDTYFDDVIPDGVQTDSKATIIQHQGFKGLEYGAVKQFCLAYELNLPNVPILMPEFCNPLFLKIICDTLEASGEKVFPKGFNGVSAMFNQYFKTLDKKFAEKKQEYKHRDVVSAAVKRLAFPVFEAEYNLLKKQDADAKLLQQFPACPNLLADLIDNNVLLKTKSRFSDGTEDYIVFSYQRISDFIIAQEIVKKYQDWNSFAESINTDKALRNVIVENHWSFKGILEAFAILIPELFNHEITDLAKFIPEEKLKRNYDECLEYLSEVLINSLAWRSIESINKDVIREFLNSEYCRLYDDAWWYKLVELSVIPNHPFNADYFHAIMMRGTMPQRDGTFQYFFNGCAGYDDERCANPLRRLIDWAWSKDVSVKAESESIRLAAIMLCWLLSSTYIKHRDEATKALVNLLSEQVDVLIDTLHLFEDVDDMYISERLYAVAYGVALRTSSRDGLAKLARYVYETIFKHNCPPKDILLRDYARNIVEYAKYKVGLTGFDMKKVRPPYSSVLPKWPTDEEVEHYHIDYDAPDFKERKGSEQNQIWESVKGGLADFWNKLAEPRIEHFYPISIAEEKDFEKAIRLFKGDMRKLINVFSDTKAYRIMHPHNTTKKQTLRDTLFDTIENRINQMMTEEQLITMNEVIIPFKVKERSLLNHHYGQYPTEGVRNWLVKRAYDLGFDVNLHGDYDRFAKDWTFRNSGNRIDRVGKKYQWIAFYEIMGILADNFKYHNEYANEGSGGYELFHGTWQSFLRDINPSMIVRVKSDDVDDTEDGREVDAQKWYDEEQFNHWEYSGTNESWASMTRDLPDPVSLIQKMDDDGVEWLTLNNARNWDEPKDLGTEIHEYNLLKHDVFMAADAILVKQEDKEKAIQSLDGRVLWDGVELPTDDWQWLVNREKYWSPAYKDVYRDQEGWSNSIDGLDVPYLYTCEQACGHIEGDSSGTISKYSIPCRLLFEGMGMEYDSHDGQYLDKEGNLVALTCGFDQILVRKEPLLRFLEQCGLAILWIVRGEKRVYISGGMGCQCVYAPCGVFYLDENSIPEGVLESYKRV